MRRFLLPATSLLIVASVLWFTGCRDTTAPPLGPVSLLVVSGDEQQGVVGTTLPQPLVVKAINDRGRRIKGLEVRFEVTSGGGSAVAGSDITDPHGLAQDRWTLGTSTAEPQRLEARAVETGELLGAFTATALPGPVADLSITAGDGQTAVHGTTVLITPAVRVADQYGNPVPGVAVTFAVATGGGTVDGATPASDADGIATIGSWTLGASLGENTLTATVADVAPVTFTAMATVGPAARMVIHAGDNQTAQRGTVVPVPPAVRITDESGEPVAGVRPTFTITLGSGAVSGSTPTSGPDGVAAVESWTLGSTPGTYTLRATAPDIADTVYFTATATPGPVDATQSTVTASPPDIAASAGTEQSTIAVTARDEGGYPISGAMVEIAASGGGNTITQPTSPTDENGLATGTISSTAIGLKVVNATIDGVDITQAAAVIVHGGAAATIELHAGDQQTAYANTAVAIPPAVLVRDAFGNPTAGAAVRFEDFTGGGVCCAQPVPTDENGVAALERWTLGVNPGTYTLTATVPGVDGSVTFTATAIPLAASIEVFAGDNQSATAGSAVAIQPTVRVRDASGNPTGGVLVEFSVTGGGGSIGGDTRRLTVAPEGIAWVDSWTLGPAAGLNTLTATVAGTELSVTFTATGEAAFWTTQASLPTRRYLLSAGTANGILYAVGGADLDYMAIVEAYDPGTDTWTSRAPMPTARGELGVGVINGVLYAVGGYDGRDVLATVEAYDPVTNTWSTKASLPVARADLAVAVAGGILYAIGGATCTPPEPGAPCTFSSVGTVDAYDPATDTWTARASMPTPRTFLGAGTVNGIIYAAGGQTLGSADFWLSTVEAYDPASDSWSARSPMPTPRFALGVSVIGGLLYALGGESPVGSQILEAYDPVSDMWGVRAAMPTGRSFFGTAAVLGLLYAVGGNGAFDVVEAYHP